MSVYSEGWEKELEGEIINMGDELVFANVFILLKIKAFAKDVSACGLVSNTGYLFTT